MHFDIDATDEALIAVLQEYPSITNKDLSEQLAVSEGTVATRIRALEEANVIRVIMQRDIRSLGFGVLAHIDINVAGRPPEAVARDLAKIPQITGVSTTLGSPDIIIHVHARNLAHMQAVIDREVGIIEGIDSYEIFVSMEVVKLDQRYGVLDAG